MAIPRTPPEHHDSPASTARGPNDEEVEQLSLDDEPLSPSNIDPPASLLSLFRELRSEIQLLRTQRERDQLRLEELERRLRSTSTLTPAAPSVPASTPLDDEDSAQSLKEPKMAEAPEFNGKISETSTFLAHCELLFELKPHTYGGPTRKVLYVISRLRSPAFEWAEGILKDKAHPFRTDYTAFLKAFNKVYGDRTRETQAMERLANLRQTGSAMAYAATFNSLASIVGITDQVSKLMEFKRGLSPELRKLIVVSGEPRTFEAYVAKAIEIHQGTYLIGGDERNRSSTAPVKPTSSAPQRPTAAPSAPRASSAPRAPPSHPQSQRTPGTPLPREEIQRRIDNNLCKFCGIPGHYATSCPELKAKLAKAPARSTPAPAYSAKNSTSQSK